MPQKILATVRVRCSGNLHRISLAENGRLIFHDHAPGMVLERVVATLGADPCRCLEVLERWRETIKSLPYPIYMQGRKIPKGLMPFADARRAVYWQRQVKRIARLWQQKACTST